MYPHKVELGNERNSLLLYKLDMVKKKKQKVRFHKGDKRPNSLKKS